MFWITEGRHIGLTVPSMKPQQFGSGPPISDMASAYVEDVPRPTNSDQGH